MTEAVVAWEPPGGGELVHPRTGELIDVSDPLSCVNLLSDVRELESQLRELKGALTEALRSEFTRQGTKTLDFSTGVKAVLGGGSEIVWDVEVLQELLDLGLPEERMNELVTAEISYKVNNSVVKQLSMNPQYAEVIERAKSVIPKASYVTLKKDRA